MRLFGAGAKDGGGAVCCGGELKEKLVPVMVDEESCARRSRLKRLERNSVLRNGVWAVEERIGRKSGFGGESGE